MASSQKGLVGSGQETKKEEKPEDDGKSEGKEALQIEMAPSADSAPADATSSANAASSEASS